VYETVHIIMLGTPHYHIFTRYRMLYRLHIKGRGAIFQIKTVKLYVYVCNDLINLDSQA